MKKIMMFCLIFTLLCSVAFAKQESGLEFRGDPESANSCTWNYFGEENGVAYRLSGAMMKPKGNGPFPAVILSHGKGGSAQDILRNIGAEMVSWGIVVIAVNYTHAREAVAQGAPGEANGMFDGASMENILRAKKAYDILCNLPYVDKSRIAAHGHSMGAFVTGGLVGMYPDAFWIASHTAGGSTEASQRLLASATKAEQVEKIKLPYLLQHGDEDQVVGIGLAKNMYNTLLKNDVQAELIIQQGIDHSNIASSPLTMKNIKGFYEKYGMFLSRKTVVLTVGNEKASINGKRFAIDGNHPVTPLIENDRTLVPARFIAEAFGASVDYVDDTVIIRYQDVVSKVAIGDNILIVGDREVPLEVAAKIMHDRTMLPLRAICEEVLHKTVHYENGVITVTDKAEYKKISPGQAKEMMEKENVIILDVRTQSEYDGGHIKGAVLLPNTEIAPRALAMLPDKNATILVYCRSGARSKNASDQLVALGYFGVFDFGGIIDWPYEVIK